MTFDDIVIPQLQSALMHPRDFVLDTKKAETAAIVQDIVLEVASDVDLTFKIDLDEDGDIRVTDTDRQFLSLFVLPEKIDFAVSRSAANELSKESGVVRLAARMAAEIFEARGLKTWTRFGWVARIPFPLEDESPRGAVDIIEDTFLSGFAGRARDLIGQATEAKSVTGAFRAVVEDLEVELVVNSDARKNVFQVDLDVQAVRKTFEKDYLDFTDRVLEFYATRLPTLVDPLLAVEGLKIDVMTRKLH